MFEDDAACFAVRTPPQERVIEGQWGQVSLEWDSADRLETKQTIQIGSEQHLTEMHGINKSTIHVINVILVRVCQVEDRINILHTSCRLNCSVGPQPVPGSKQGQSRAEDSEGDWKLRSTRHGWFR